MCWESNSIHRLKQSKHTLSLSLSHALSLSHSHTHCGANRLTCWMGLCCGNDKAIEWSWTLSHCCWASGLTKGIWSIYALCLSLYLPSHLLYTSYHMAFHFIFTTYINKTVKSIYHFPKILGIIFHNQVYNWAIDFSFPPLFLKCLLDWLHIWPLSYKFAWRSELNKPILICLICKILSPIF